MNKLQLTLTGQEAQILTAQADRLGYSLARYAKFLLSGAAAQSLGLNQKLDKATTLLCDNPNHR